MLTGYVITYIQYMWIIFTTGTKTTSSEKGDSHEHYDQETGWPL